MSALRTRMIEDMQLAGLSATTQEVYLQAVTALVKHYRNRSPAPKPARVVVGAAPIGGRPRSKPSLLSLGAIGIIVYGG